MENILLAAFVITVVGILGAAVLVLAAHFMQVKEDPRIGEVLAVLPGANCGACGYAGCADYAKAIVENAPINKCIPGGAATADKVGEIMGAAAGAVAQVKAVVACQGNDQNTTDRYHYEGIESCQACVALYGGNTSCAFGCLGFGDCVKVCTFDAIHVQNGVASVDLEKCTGCGACKAACPKKIIWMQEDCSKPVVLCANHNKGALTRKACSAGCIGCMRCQKTCPEGAIEVKNNVARIDYGKCTGCGKCVEVCPVKCICIPEMDAVLS